MKRRDFLKNAGCFIISVGVVKSLSACSDEGGGRADADAGDADGGASGEGRYGFPQGVASGDPRADSVMLWTRIVPLSADATDDEIPLRVEIAEDADFKKLVAHEDLMASPAADRTVRVLVEGLSADTVYYYRFAAGADKSRTGRTWTAPEEGADVPVRFAWASCQDYTAGFYGAWRRMLKDDEAAEEAERLRFVLFLGDFIYETRGAGFQTALDPDLMPVMLEDRNGDPRQLPAFPSGGGKLDESTTYAQTLDDYRELYKHYLSDPDLQDARARWPFVSVWDDHEFTDDCWQTQANYTDDKSFDEPSQKRRVAASQAWFEFVPAILTDANGLEGVDPQSKDFAPVDVEDVAYDDPVDVDEPNNSDAISAISIYRSLRFGKHVDLVLTDNRSYRSDHAIPEDVSHPSPLVFAPRGGLPLNAVNTFDAGMTANGGDPPDMAGGFENTRKNSPPGSMLGDAQKKWWKDSLQKSTATFKVWGNSVPLLRLRLDTTGVALFSSDLLLSADAWDGYASERRELMSFLRDQNVRNVVSLSGDHHAHLVGVVMDDYDAAAPKPVMTDFSAAGISSNSQWTLIAGAIGAKVTPALEALVAPVLALITYDASALGGSRKAVPNLNTLLRYGAPAAALAAQTNDLAMAEAARNPKVNSHLRYVDTAANGYGLAAFDGDKAELTLVTIAPPIADAGEEGADLSGTAAFTLPVVGSDGELSLDEPTLTGMKPFPLA